MNKLYKEEKYTCPVCGYPELTEIPWKDSFNSEGCSDEICSSCGTQFGYTDWADGIFEDRLIRHKELREEWLKSGWDKGRSEPPEGWNPIEQLKNIGIFL